MARTEARIRCSIWEDADFLALTWEAQWLYHAILEQKDLSLCGVLTWTPKRFAKLAANGSPAAAKKALDLLRDRRYVVLDDDTDELWVRSFVKGDRVIDKPNMVVGMAQSFGAIRSQPIRQGLLQGLGQGFLQELPQRFDRWLTGGFAKRMPQPFLEAFALAHTQAPPRAPVPPASSLQPPASSLDPNLSSSDHHGDPPESADDDDGEAGAVHAITDRRMAGLGTSVANPRPYRAKVLQSVRDELGPHIRRMLAEGSTVEQVCDALEPVAERPAPQVTPHPKAGQQLSPAWELDEDGNAVPMGVSA